MARTGDMDIRHERILDILSKESVISVTNLSNILGVAKETVRKDLKILAEQGKVIRIHGGAALLETPFNFPFTVRQNLDEIKKRRVAERASRLIYENESIIIEGSTTNLALCEALMNTPEKLRSLSIITNSVKIAHMLDLGAKCRQLFLLGGRTDAQEGTIRGTFALAMLREIHADAAFISAAAIDQRLSVTAFKEDDMLFQRQAIASSNKAYILMNSSKFPSSSLYHVCKCQEIDGLVTDAILDEETSNLLLQTNTEYIQVEQ